MSGDVALAELLVLRRVDLEGEGWREEPSQPVPDQGAGHADDVLARCLGPGFPEEAVTALADSPRFLRPPARLAYGTAIVFDGPEPARRVAERVEGTTFAVCFAQVVADDVAVGPGGTSLLGSTARRLAPGVHRVTFVAGTSTGLLGLHLDLVVLAAGRALVLVWLADSPEPFPDDDRRALSRRLRARLDGAG